MVLRVAELMDDHIVDDLPRLSISRQERHILFFPEQEPHRVFAPVTLTPAGVKPVCSASSQVRWGRYS